MLNRTFSARISSMLLIVHGVIEISSLTLLTSMPLALISFGGLTGPALERNASSVAMFGVFWGMARLVAAWGTWSMRKWALILAITLSIITVVASITIIPAGVIDTLFALTALVFLLYAWFGNEVKEMTPQ